MPKQRVTIDKWYTFQLIYTTARTFTDEESERLEKLNEKCWEIAEKENVNIYEVSMRFQKLIWGEPKKKKLKPFSLRTLVARALSFSTSKEWC